MGAKTEQHVRGYRLYGNTHFPMSDLNNGEIPNRLAEFLHHEGLDVGPK